MRDEFSQRLIIFFCSFGVSENLNLQRYINPLQVL